MYDSFVTHVISGELFGEAFQLLKPGAHGFVRCESRVSHRVGVLLESSGFELRDMVMEFGVGSVVWWLIRKPLSEGTIVENVLVHGTGAINVDGCRIPGVPEPTRFDPAKHRHEGWRMNATGAETAERASSLGRYPSNMVFSHSEGCESLGVKKVRGSNAPGRGSSGEGERGIGFSAGVEGKPGQMPFYTDPDAYGMETVESWRCVPGCPVKELDEQSGASRFFYTSKVSSAERELPDGTLNTHPTAKSVKLMKYFVRMVTPAGGVVLDPFTGSGTTGVAALEEGMSFFGAELDVEHHRVAKVRLEAATEQAQGKAAEKSLMDMVFSDD